MHRFVLLPLAEQDLEEVWAGIAEHNPKAADDLIHRIFEKFDRIQYFPEIGALRPDLGQSIRLLIERPYIIPYMINIDGAAVIIRVLHGAQNLDNIIL